MLLEATFVFTGFHFIVSKYPLLVIPEKHQDEKNRNFHLIRSFRKQNETKEIVPLHAASFSSRRQYSESQIADADKSTLSPSTPSFCAVEKPHFERYNTVQKADIYGSNVNYS